MQPHERIESNPFLVLGVAVNASRAEIERAGQRLLAELALDRKSAREYSTPLGPVVRTADAVRSALAELRDPERRLVHELWATLLLGVENEPQFGGLGWSAACALLGVRGVKKV